MSSDIRYDMFTKNLKDLDFITMLLNYMKKIEKQLIYLITRTSKKTNLRGKSPAGGLSDAVDFIAK